MRECKLAIYQLRIVLVHCLPYRLALIVLFEPVEIRPNAATRAIVKSFTIPTRRKTLRDTVEIAPLAIA
jgi:hypothetical protein